ncbi:SET domain-containing protein-lysine N-methyltransferase [Caenimonas aquaedulcis]|uniref:SET domain-containing protein-lysine N-methyltransferase n=1 Tax=Caenimonas aquaedulcis TaxID=2793270 RepID=A0A931MIJ6_9BURK|nr:SET domain-containing protein [Caenimonas aquaedulcis]MBG9389330.1 SET domain-containing protein-lysine N-methyltransferase [Caenimonas aquaedulcis]
MTDLEVEGQSMTLLEIIRRDYLRVLAEVGWDAERVAAVVHNTADQCPMPPGYEHLRLAPSPIQGQGLFTDRAIESGEVIGPARIDGKRTWLGRYANHSPWPNTEFRLLENGDLEWVALEDIAPGAEILNNYRQGASIWGAKFNPEEVARTMTERDESLRRLAALQEAKA